MAERVCAFVLTHNRLALLQTCIEQLRQQTRRADHILVVDNGSDDGTRAWLAAQEDVSAVLQENLGTGPGYGKGLRWGYEQGYDWLWVMDDDCVPAPDALAHLMEAVAARPDVRVFNSLGLAHGEPPRLSHGRVSLRTREDDYLNGEFVYSVEGVRARADARGMVDSIGGQLYLGTMFHREIIDKVGVTTPMIFWGGEEVDYSLRIMGAGYHIWFVPSSHVYHPAMTTVFVNIMGVKFPCQKMSAFRRYNGIRNRLYIEKKYYPHHPLVPYIARRVTGAFITELLIDRDRPWRDKINGCVATLRGVRDGLQMQVSGEG